ncbi:MAG: hypothetical protein IT447_11495 [Phycisphaerales bacterium]|nr:hypothetical protein [Phycisphaerales bacterium]
MPTTRYFREQVQRKRPYLRIEWCQRVLSSPMKTEVEANGRIRHWGWIQELDKWLRVVMLEDGRTVHNAFPDRDFLPEHKP